MSVFRSCSAGRASWRIVGRGGGLSLYRVAWSLCQLLHYLAVENEAFTLKKEKKRKRYGAHLCSWHPPFVVLTLPHNVVAIRICACVLGLSSRCAPFWVAGFVVVGWWCDGGDGDGDGG
jgi:hypothetical protein